MTAYVEGPTVAHVVEWATSYRGTGWHALCLRPQWVVIPHDYRDRQDEWPLRHAWGSERQPALPWCKRCTQIAQRRVDELTATVLTPPGRT